MGESALDFNFHWGEPCKKNLKMLGTEVVSCFETKPTFENLISTASVETLKNV